MVLRRLQRHAEQAGLSPVSWTIPHTEITLTRVADGPRAGQFLFSPSTVDRAREFYEKTRTLPYRRDVPIKNYPEKRPYLSITSWMISSRTIEGFPGWLKRSVYEQAVWKWIVLAMLVVMIYILVVVVHKFKTNSANKYVRHLLMPFVLLLAPLASNIP